jgi:ATPase subunit of ABC transporter with duplicated ATPase domains
LINKELPHDTNLLASLFEKYVWELACELQRDGEGLSTAEQIQISESLKDLNQILNQIVKGDFKRDAASKGSPFSLFEEGQEATKAENLSMGLKFFVLLRHMLQKGILNKKDILILDEPENHLHPEWQVQYAKILVLLQKTYDLTLLVTSHSPDMISALQRIAEVEQLDGINFYLAESSEENPSMFTYRNLGKDVEPIFHLFNVAIDNIDTYPEIK